MEPPCGGSTQGASVHRKPCMQAPWVLAQHGDPMPKKTPTPFLAIVIAIEVEMYSINVMSITDKAIL